VRKSTGTGYARVVQVVPLPSTDATLQASLKIAATATSTAWSGAALRIDYLDQDGFPLGETIIGAQSTYCPWADGPTTHIIPVVDSNWKDYSLDLNDELTNLPGVDPPQIRQVRIALVAYAQDC
jgi:hypothetical protein